MKVRIPSSVPPFARLMLACRLYVPEASWVVSQSPQVPVMQTGVVVAVFFRPVGPELERRSSVASRAVPFSTRTPGVATLPVRVVPSVMLTNSSCGVGAVLQAASPMSSVPKVACNQLK